MTPQPGEITVIHAGAEFHTCPACGYALGFHTSFLGTNTDKDNPVKSTREVYRVILICPECGARYDVGWRVSFAELESRFVKTSVTPLHSLVSPDAPSPGSLHVSVVSLPPGPRDENRHSPQ